MGWKSFWQGLVQNLLATVIVLAGGALIAVLQATHSHWSGPALYGLIGTASIAILIFALTGRPILSTKQPQTSLRNVEENIRRWLDYFGLTVQKKTEPEAHFVFAVTSRGGMGLYIARLKARERYIVFGSNIQLIAEHEQVLAALPKEKSQRIVEELALELAKTGVGFNLGIQPDGTLKMIGLQRNILITPNLTEDVFASCVDQIESNANVAKEAIRLSLDNAKQLLPPAK